MESIKVVRLELKGTGIFISPYVDMDRVEIAGVYHRHKEFPCPESEGLDLREDGKEWFCAYKTIEQVQQWLRKEEIQYFISIGFRVLLLTVNEYQLGEYQVIFTKESIESKEDITSLFA